MTRRNNTCSLAAALTTLFVVATGIGCADSRQGVVVPPIFNPNTVAEPAEHVDDDRAEPSGLPRILVVEIDRSDEERAADERLRAALEQDITLPLETAQLKPTLDVIAQQAGVEMAVNWAALALVDIYPAAPVVVKFETVSASAALEFILDAASANNFDGDRMAFHVHKGILLISTIDEGRRSHAFTRAYDISPLLNEPSRPIGLAYSDNAFAAAMDIRYQLRREVPSPLTRGALVELYEYHIEAMEDELDSILDGTYEPATSSKEDFDALGFARAVLTQDQEVDGLFGNPSNDIEGVMTRDERLDRLHELIVDTVGDIDEWLDEDSIIRESNDDFVIKTSPTNHAQIEAMLNGLLFLEMRAQARALRDAQVVMLLNQATLLQQAGEFSAALPLIERALQIDPNHITAIAMYRVVAETLEREAE